MSAPTTGAGIGGAGTGNGSTASGGAAAGAGGGPNTLRRDQAATSSMTAAGGSSRRRIDDSESNWLADDWTSESDTDYSSDEGTVAAGGDGTTYDEESLRLGAHTAAGGNSRSTVRHHHAPRDHRPNSSVASSATLVERSPISPWFERGRPVAGPGARGSKMRGADSGKAAGPLLSYVTNEWQKKDYKDDGVQHPYYRRHPKYNNRHPSQRRRSPSPTCCDDMLDAPGWVECLGVAWRRLTPRIAAIWALVFLVLFTGWWWVFGGAARRHATNSLLQQSVRHRMGGGSPRGPRGWSRSWFGSQWTPDFRGLEQVARLNETRDWRWADGARLVVVGDVHGCADNLEALLAKLAFNPAVDHLAFTGDLVAKGPDTSRVLDIAIAHNASCVRGNHDDKLLMLRRDLKAPLRHTMELHGKPSPSKDGVVEGKTDDTKDAGRGTDFMTGRQIFTKQSDLARSLSPQHFDYLAACPLVLDLGPLPGLAPQALLVHAGLVAGLNLTTQDPASVMNMRSVDLRTYTPLNVHCPSTQRELEDAAWQAAARRNQNKRPGTDTNANPPVDSVLRELPPPWNDKLGKKKKGAGAGGPGAQSRGPTFDLEDKYVVPWNRLWEEWQAATPSDRRTLALYGHDAVVGLVEGDWAVGLDSGCARGGRLSALVLTMTVPKRFSFSPYSSTSAPKIKRRVESVDCADVARALDRAKKEAKQAKAKGSGRNARRAE